ncbi:hypothetical protein HYFRA_00013079 [Hymenoscyphus fraxineus]|uniref:Uncharacterized protein n=1 Tax=Hymenoscyphus fraxineus TaxID=746836 RepID=A0A9N9L4H3_9HELO|nr:hypothetical protein HYFRA_00013079 [Hymenoscyphus fraxineus]
MSSPDQTSRSLWCSSDENFKQKLADISDYVEYNREKLLDLVKDRGIRLKSEEMTIPHLVRAICTDDLTQTEFPFPCDEENDPTGFAKHAKDTRNWLIRAVLLDIKSHMGLKIHLDGLMRYETELWNNRRNIVDQISATNVYLARRAMGSVEDATLEKRRQTVTLVEEAAALAEEGFLFNMREFDSSKGYPWQGKCEKILKRLSKWVPKSGKEWTMEDIGSRKSCKSFTNHLDLKAETATSSATDDQPQNNIAAKDLEAQTEPKDSSGTNSRQIIDLTDEASLLRVVLFTTQNSEPKPAETSNPPTDHLISSTDVGPGTILNEDNPAATDTMALGTKAGLAMHSQKPEYNTNYLPPPSQLAKEPKQDLSGLSSSPLTKKTKPQVAQAAKRELSGPSPNPSAKKTKAEAQPRRQTLPKVRHSLNDKPYVFVPKKSRKNAVTLQPDSSTAQELRDMVAGEKELEEVIYDEEGWYVVYNSTHAGKDANIYGFGKEFEWKGYRKCDLQYIAPL